MHLNVSTTKQSRSGQVISFSSDGVKAMNRLDDEVKKKDIKKQKRKLWNVVKASILNSSYAYVHFSMNIPSPVRFCTLFWVHLPLQGIPT